MTTKHKMLNKVIYTKNNWIKIVETSTHIRIVIGTIERPTPLTHNAMRPEKFTLGVDALTYKKD